ncbi:bromodomain and WD repeat-containing protein 3 [Pectinophora gossypiella]|uniref:bromodomain and WD repeat-containing protein 3 n=1 Tax=Pectinophora gossypiella TaxID=13191 RepID=UPI00214EFF8B|nr:bromodomain and WD repeat-containing protein 3 [Pectinophora gossypiella]
MEESNEELRVVPELYFLIAKFLSGGPLKETAKTLLKELESVEVLPRRLDWEGNEHAQSYNELASQYEDMSWRRLAMVCSRALELARAAAAAPGAALPAPGAPLAGTIALSARLSLLSDSLVRPKPEYTAYKEDHSLVRRVSRRELGLGDAARAGGRAGPAMMSPRLLRGLRLQRRTLGHLSAVYCVVFDRTGRYVLTGADDLLVKVWSAIDGRLLATLRGAGAEITDACVSSDGALLACGSVERLVRVWCLRSAAPRAVLAAHAGTITSVHWAPGARSDVRWLASTSTDGSVAFWTCSADGQFLSQPVQYVERMRPGACHMICAAWSAGGSFLAAGSADHHVRVYMVQDNAPPRRVLEVAVHGDAVDSLAWAHRGLRFLSGSKDGCAAVWTLHATQWRHQLLACGPLPGAAPDKKNKVTMVCWDASDAYILTAVSDNTVRVWCARTCTQTRALSGHRDEAYVLEAHPALAGVVLSAGHDGQLLVWHAPSGELLSRFHNHIPGQGDGAIFDAKWGGPTSIAATDSHGHLLLLGLGQGHPLLADLPTELFFHTDYRPLVRDALGGALDEQTEMPPHLMAPPFLVDVEGAPHAPRFQRLVPGRENLALDQLVPVALAAPSRLDVSGLRYANLMIEALAGSRSPPAPGGAGPGGEAGARAAGGPWRGEGVRHTGGAWAPAAPLEPHAARPLVRAPPAAALRRQDLACAELNAWEQSWYRREMRRRPVMISTAVDSARPVSPAVSIHSESSLSSPSSPSSHSSHSSHSSRHSRPSRPSRPPRPPRSLRRSTDSDSSCSYTSGKTDESSESSYSDWEAGENLAPPARAKRRPLPAKRYSPSTTGTRRGAASTSAAPAPGAGAPPPAAPAPGAELPEAYRPGEWLTAVAPRKAPYHPQMGDHCLYFRLGHQRYFEAVSEKDVYKVNPRDKPWERTHIHECELVKVVGVKYVIKPPRTACVRLASTLSPRSFTVRYHDMPDVIDFLVLRHHYDAAAARRWAQGDRFRCMIDDSWWTGIVLERTPAAPPAAVGTAAAGADAAAAWSAQAAPHFLSLRVRWDNGEVERLSPWDLEPLDPERLPAEPGGSVPVLPHELEAVLYRAEPDEWPPRGERAAACRAIAQHIGQVMSLSAAEPFVAPVDLQAYPSYAMVVPYPIDLATIRARFDNLFYRRTAAAQFDVRYLATNAEQFNEPHSPIVRQARLVTDLLLHIISHWREVDVVGKYHELAASYHSSDDEPKQSNTRNNKAGPRAAPAWRASCGAVLRELMSSADAGPFREPVAEHAAPDYRSVVPRPLDLGTIARRLAAGRYARPARFAADVRRVFANSRLYNTNKRSRIYSMTVRLSALFESLWTRVAAPAGPRPRRAAARGYRRHEPRSEPGSQEESEEAGGWRGSGGSGASGSSSEPLAAARRRARAQGSDSDAPLHPRKHAKGKGVGKKSKSSSASVEPAPSTSRDHHDDEILPAQNGVASDSEDEALARLRTVPPPAHNGGGGGDHNGDGSDASYCDIEVLEEELDDDVQLQYTRSSTRQRRGKRRRTRSSASSAAARTPRKRAVHTRTRERFTTRSSSESSSSSSSGSGRSARRYESDRSYKPRYSTDDDAPLLLYRQRQAEGEPGPSTSSQRSAAHTSRGGGNRGVSLRARRSPRRYNEDSEEDSVACISKRLPHHHRRHQRQRDLDTRRRHHATQVIYHPARSGSHHLLYQISAPS